VNRQQRRAARSAPPAVPAAYAPARREHQAGRLREAEALYRRALAEDPRHADSLHGLGVLAGLAGRHDLAAAYIGAAIALRAGEPAYHADLGSAWHAQGRLAEAAASFQQALSLRPEDAEAQFKLGNLLKQQGRTEAACACYRRAIARHPGYAAAHNNLGTTLQALGQPGAAACFREAVRLDPAYPAAHNNLGNALRGEGRLEEAVTSFRAALALQPHYPAALSNLGNALKDLGRLEEAAASFRAALALQPDLAIAHNNLGSVLHEQRRLDDAVESFGTALALQPGLLEARVNLGVALFEQRRLDEAVACHRSVLAEAADFPAAHFNLALALLARGDLAEGWEELEWRWLAPPLRGARRAFAQPQWCGEPAAGRALLIHAEQGYGDTLQFCRYAGLAAARGLRVILEVPQALWRLLAGLPGVAQMVVAGDPLPPFDLHCPMLSLPRALGTTLGTIPASVPYLSADPGQAEDWRRRLASRPGADLRVGLAWAGNPRSHLPSAAAVDRRRSIAPARLAPLFAVPGVVFHSLQKDGPAAAADAPLTDDMAEMADFADTAALVANLDLVISVDSAVAHLAGALGRPVWLLDRFDACWRWLDGRQDSPWYPTLRIYRQAVPDDWDEVIQRVAADLLALSAASGRPTPTSPAS
jgi:tetratricopeptide (TPR) repeat protein